MVDRVTLLPNRNTIWWFFKFLTVTKLNCDTFLANRDTIFLAYKYTQHDFLVFTP